METFLLQSSAEFDFHRGKCIEFVSDLLFPHWQNDLITTALKIEQVRRLAIDNGRVKEREILFNLHKRSSWQMRTPKSTGRLKKTL